PFSALPKAPCNSSCARAATLVRLQVSSSRTRMAGVDTDSPVGHAPKRDDGLLARRPIFLEWNISAAVALQPGIHFRQALAAHRGTLLDGGLGLHHVAAAVGRDVLGGVGLELGDDAGVAGIEGQARRVAAAAGGLDDRVVGVL